MFAGSGCIGIAVLKHTKNSEVVFVDNDKKCLKQIKINLKINLLQDAMSQNAPTTSLIRANKGCTKEKRCFVVSSDIFSNIRGKFDYIFANPPYIPDYRKNPSPRFRAILRNRVQKSVLKYEPKKALFAGKEGLFYIRKFLKQSKNYLNQGGPSLPVRHRANGVRASKIFMEFSPEQKRKIEKLLKKYKYKDWKFYKDQYNKWRWVMIT